MTLFQGNKNLLASVLFIIVGTVIGIILLAVSLPRVLNKEVEDPVVPNGPNPVNPTPVEPIPPIVERKTDYFSLYGKLYQLDETGKLREFDAGNDMVGDVYLDPLGKGLVFEILERDMGCYEAERRYCYKPARIVKYDFGTGKRTIIAKRSQYFGKFKDVGATFYLEGSPVYWRELLGYSNTGRFIAYDQDGLVIYDTQTGQKQRLSGSDKDKNGFDKHFITTKWGETDQLLYVNDKGPFTSGLIRIYKLDTESGKYRLAEWPKTKNWDEIQSMSVSEGSRKLIDMTDSKLLFQQSHFFGEKTTIAIESFDLVKKKRVIHKTYEDANGDDFQAFHPFLIKGKAIVYSLTSGSGIDMTEYNFPNKYRGESYQSIFGGVGKISLDKTPNPQEDFIWLAESGELVDLLPLWGKTRIGEEIVYLPNSEAIFIRYSKVADITNLKTYLQYRGVIIFLEQDSKGNYIQHQTRESVFINK